MRQRIRRRRPREGRIRRPREELGSRRWAASTAIACSGGSGGAVAEAKDSGAPEAEGPSARPAARRWRKPRRRAGVDGVGGGGGDLREGVNARGFRQGSQCEGVQARLAAWLAPRRLLSSGGKVLGEEEKASENIYIKY
uniref:DUF834 domain-containing protein n=1 Tax=Oryza glumipatula TaxID=40148 RepID=A0A0E0BQB0_9ORYZ